MLLLGESLKDELLTLEGREQAVGAAEKTFAVGAAVVVVAGRTAGVL